MILADKIIALRKKSGWSQEELAEKMNVTRQAVSKWEGAQSIPDLEKILQLARLFGVSTDYLLKDELGEADYAPPVEDAPEARRVSMEEANEFLAIKEFTAKRIAFATFLCIIGVICLLLFGAAGEAGALGLSEDGGGLVGLTGMLVIVAGAVAVFISCGMKTSRFEYLEKEVFETEYGVSGMVRERQSRYHDTYTRSNVCGACICILSPIPLFLGAFLSENELFLVGMLCVTLLLAGVGAMFFIEAGINWASMQKLLQEGDYTRQHKRGASPEDALGTAYWLIVTAGFLAYSFVTEDWKNSWIVWPVAGVLYGAFAAIYGILSKRKEQKPKE